MTAPAYKLTELMAIRCAKEIVDGEVVFVGVGLPLVVAGYAMVTHAKNMVMFTEGGAIRATAAPGLAITVDDPCLFTNADASFGMLSTMAALQRGEVDVAFIGGAQIDKYGNINSTVVGDYYKPKVRFPGSGGANDFASLCWRTMIMTVHSKSRFVEKCEFLTSPGFLTGAGAREAAGLPEGGPYKIVTDLAVMGFDEETKAMRVESLHPGVDLDKVKAETGFELVIPKQISSTAPPTETELKILREEVDPLKLVIGRG